ncbi:Spy/CpxP family protein refolding chaperone [Bradyrhizobium sp. 83002]|uniref:Spy/CpxP family protein refolding chaperone n=1 Tax=Bradyrhizobium aeschynomenes TaxID=2734909 RepID=UPI001556410A|nr:Spy/CpxP family protein refolding chaperone [Bradyrhizobium aeschynomenes]NPU13040.1 Spy/CpxP family protein refolding chaperone [Bradyrhizobium aeschynomenes]NPV23364.1 Spy/CpxP family protein refolding chaperone [Bradyrhizobium aeschynomenes]
MRADPRALILAAAVMAATVAPSFAQPGAGGPPGWGPGMMMGPGMMGGRGFGFLCNPRMAGFAEWRLSQIESAIKPNETQRARLDDLKTASAKAAELITKDCPTAFPTRATERLALAEERLDAMQQAIKLVRPAFQALYDSLDDKQKAAMDASGPRKWGWHHWHWPWNDE